MRRWALDCVATAGLAACSPFGGGAFHCESDPACGTGTCQPNGLCAFADATCPSGWRYGEASGELSGTCVGDEPDARVTIDGPAAADADTTDAPPVIDATPPVDATPTCDVAISASDSSAGQVGSNGGSAGPDLICPAGDEIIGVAARISDQDTTNGGRSAVGMTILCAAITTGGAGPTTGAESAVEVAGTGMFGWTPATQSELTRCPPGHVLSGLDISRGNSNDLFLDLTITCAELGFDGAPTGTTVSIYVNGTLDDGANHDSATCPGDRVARRFGTRRGAGLDAVTLFCAEPTCQ